MKTSIYVLTASLMRKASDYINQSKERRLMTGLTLVGGSSMYVLMSKDIIGYGNPMEIMMYYIVAVLFVQGLVILTGSVDLVNRILARASKEVAGIFALACSIMIIYFYLSDPTSFTDGAKPVAILLAALVATRYVARMSKLVYRIVRKISSMLTDKVKSELGKMQSRTETCDKTLDNVVSIAGKLSLIVNSIKPLIKMIIG